MSEIAGRWERVLKTRGGEPAVFTPEGGCARTFRQIEREAKRFERSLRVIGRRAVVSIQLENRAEWFALILAVLRNEQVALLVDRAATRSVRDPIEANCGAAVRVTSSGGGICFQRLSNPVADWEGADPGLLKMTSGTTADPRVIKFTTAQILADCDHICRTMALKPDDINYGAISFSHSYGFSNLVTPLLCEGIAVVVAPDVLPRSIADGMRLCGATVLPAVPPVFHALSSIDAEMGALRLCISAGAPLRAETCRAFRERFGLGIHSFYGASECGGICFDRNGAGGSDGFVGESLEGVEVEASGAFEQGYRIQVKSAAVGMGYHPAWSDDPLRDGTFIPSDILRREDGGWRIIGRATDFINIGGRKVNAAEVERTLRTHPAVVDVAAFARSDPMRSEAVAACVVVASGVRPEELRRHCADNLPGWQVPRAIFVVDAIPHNNRGKISRRELADRFAGKPVDWNAGA